MKVKSVLTSTVHWGSCSSGLRSDYNCEYSKRFTFMIELIMSVPVCMLFSGIGGRKGEIHIQWELFISHHWRRNWTLKNLSKILWWAFYYYLVLSPFFNDIYYQIEMAIETLQKSDGLSTHRSSLLNSHVSCLFFM